MREPLVANVALVGPFTTVRPHMGGELAQLAAHFGTKVALVNQFSVFFLQWVRMLPDSVALAPRRRTAG